MPLHKADGLVDNIHVLNVTQIKGGAHEAVHGFGDPQAKVVDIGKRLKSA
jgi:hypothetical protein